VTSNIDELVQRAIITATGSPPASSSRIPIGESNQVYDVATEDGQHVIVRMSYESDPVFEHERWAIERCAEHGISVPRVLLVERVSLDPPISICIETKLDGVSLDTLLREHAGSPDKIAALVRQAGAMLARIHAVPTSRFGWIRPDGVGNRPSWASFMRKWGEKRDELVASGARIGVGARDIDGAIEILLQPHAEYQDVEPRLVHGDYTPEHILLVAGRISGVIDFGNCLSGDPAYDFAWWDYFRGEALPVAWLIEGYRGDAASLESRMRLAKLHLAFGFVEYYAITGNLRGIELTKLHLARGLAALA